jgi:hypothetical protein
MFGKLAALFSRGRPEDRRSSPRLRVRFTLVIQNGSEQRPGVGLDMSLNGCLIATKVAPQAPSFRAIFDIGERHITVNLNAVRSGTAVVDGDKLTTLGCSFSGVARDDYDVLVSFHKSISGGR